MFIEIKARLIYILLNFCLFFWLFFNNSSTLIYGLLLNEIKIPFFVFQIETITEVQIIISLFYSFICTYFFAFFQFFL